MRHAASNLTLRHMNSAANFSRGKDNAYAYDALARQARAPTPSRSFAIGSSFIAPIRNEGGSGIYALSPRPFLVLVSPIFEHNPNRIPSASSDTDDLPKREFFAVYYWGCDKISQEYL